MLQPKKILVPTDFSPNAEKALEEAVAIAEGSKADVTLMHVIHEEIIQCADTYCLDEETMEKIHTKTRETTTRKLNELVEKFKAKSVVNITPVMKMGVPYHEILVEQQEKNDDLIVMAHIGRTSLVKYLMGSVTERVMKGATCPILLVR